MELYNARDIDLSNNPKRRELQERILRKENITLFEKSYVGRDNVIKEIDGYILKPDHCYRCVNEELYQKYQELGFIFGNSKDDEYAEYILDGRLCNNNKGVDWYLGGASPRYGNIILECPADKEYFTLASDNGNGMSLDPNVKFIKSSGYKKPIPLSMITNVFDINKEKNKTR